MTIQDYVDTFSSILESPAPAAPYDNPDYINYTKLNESRQKRWFKKGDLLSTTKDALSTIKEHQHWIIITEPWCGDASHNIPWIIKMAECNPLISYEIQLRDSEPFLINEYLTNGGKAIPKVIVRDKDGNDLFVWGPRPKNAQSLFLELKNKNSDSEQQKIALQNWYNENKGEDIQNEFIQLIAAL